MVDAKRNNTVRQQGERGVLLLLIRNALESSFAAHTEILYEHVCRLAIGADGKGDAARANSVFALRLIRECVAIIVLHWKSLVFRAFHDRQPVILFDDGDVAKEVVRISSSVGAIFDAGAGEAGGLE